MSNIKFTDTLECTASHGRLAVAAQIYDEQQKKTQAAINASVLAAMPKDGQLAVFPISATSEEYIYDECKDYPIGTLLIITSSEMNLTDADGSKQSFSIGSLFYIFAQPQNNRKTLEWLQPIVNNVLEARIAALEARLKV